MHELSICRGLLRQVQAIAGRAPVHRVTLRVGPLSGVDPGLLGRAWEVAAPGSALVIEAPPLRVRCRACGAETAATMDRLTCGACGDWHTDLLSGDELLLVAVELEEPAHV
jgi:hydrogenase nickel incorporation protein HypA/HybF